VISLASEMTDRKGRHARGWLFFDAECQFCARIARWLARPMRRRGLDLAPLPDPRVSALLGISGEELLLAIRFLSADGLQRSGADALLALACELWWARPILWLARIPGMLPCMRSAYSWVARRRKCQDRQRVFHVEPG
jgi:predicted DCC family thiol-disulfide oxidoreductase YuxK